MIQFFENFFPSLLFQYIGLRSMCPTLERQLSIAEWETLVIKISTVKRFKISWALCWGSTMGEVTLCSLMALEEKKPLRSVLGTALQCHCCKWGTKLRYVLINVLTKTCEDLSIKERLCTTAVWQTLHDRTTQLTGWIIHCLMDYFKAQMPS